ncbi:Dinitrogenase iron-molybdenum cofactor biosynthesis protein [Thermodesulfobium narugense DSM 14796]|uniref:Dinitrogenase iron-molybdenum cofactor biosynthesis protein n=1 Tax=Thermodesulfobium narugense DSM 14796 TaxID=747365 RepID=M1E5Q0_9BACT|nr:NifB/NifX family molybdenum-iron cluster-binding protein [Thermodesulfobium narugense]AEE15217.1 Dinitrogenase iron-molybdenum cofactor biosynthesis protein [Thermodesulfobium narugense DSM 14796]
MRIAFTVFDKDKMIIDESFGRAKLFLVYDSGEKKWEEFENVQNFKAPQGAGLQAAQTIINANVDVVISKNIGPKAFNLLRSQNIKIYTTDEKDIKIVLKLFLEGKLEELKDPNQFGMG